MLQFACEIDGILSRREIVARILRDGDGSRIVVFFLNERDVGHELRSCNRDFHVSRAAVCVDRIHVNGIVGVRNKGVHAIVDVCKCGHRDVVIACVLACAQAHKFKTDGCRRVAFNECTFFEGVVHLHDVGCIVVSVNCRDSLETVRTENTFHDRSGHVGKFDLDTLHSVDDVSRDLNVGLIVNAARDDVDIVGVVSEFKEQSHVDDVVCADVDVGELAAFHFDKSRFCACEHLRTYTLLVLRFCDFNVFDGKVGGLVVLF